MPRINHGQRVDELAPRLVRPAGLRIELGQPAIAFERRIGVASSGGDQVVVRQFGLRDIALARGDAPVIQGFEGRAPYRVDAVLHFARFLIDRLGDPPK